MKEDVVKKNPLLLGVGNILLSDEGVGVRVVEEFTRRYQSTGLDVLDGGTAGMELLDDLADRPVVVIVDALKSSDAPGTVHLLENEQVPMFFSRKLSPHQLGLSDLLSALVMTEEFPEKLYLIGIVPESLEPGIGLSMSISTQFDTIFSQTMELLAGVLGAGFFSPR